MVSFFKHFKKALPIKLNRSNILRNSVKKEFEQGKLETDSEIILRMIITGREALRRTEEAMELKRMKLLGFEGETIDDAINNSDTFTEDETHSYNQNNFIRRY